MKAIPQPARVVFVLGLLAFAMCGCSGGSGPAAPTLGAEDQVTFEAGSLTRERDSHASGHYLWGYYLVYVDPGRNEFEIIPVRQATEHWNVLSWLEYGPCTTCFTITNLAPSGHGTLLADVRITHPFTNPNLTGFDVRGIAMFDASSEFPESGLTVSDRTLGDGELVNADGYTTLYNHTTAGSGPGGQQGYVKGRFATFQAPNALLNGYKRHISDDPANTRNALYVDSSVGVTYEVDMPDGRFVFGYAVDANWAPPIEKPVEDPMTDFGPEANCPEPWQISVSDSGGLTDEGGETLLTIDVYDHQGNMSHFLPFAECPELFTGSLLATWTAVGVGYASYQVSVANEELAPAGEYKCLISVEDIENAAAPDWLDLTAYQIHTLEVSEYHNEPPVALASADPIPQRPGEEVRFFDDGSYDPDGTIVKYEWDWENDGVYDEEGSEAYHTWDEEGTYYVQFRVTDDAGATDELDQPLEVAIQPQAGWALSWTEGSFNWNMEVAYDGVGNVYVAGGTEGFLACVRKVSSSGEAQWSITMESEGGTSWADAVAVDDLGNCYVVGCMGGTLDFDPGPGEDLHTSNGTSDTFLCKYDATGNYLWGHNWGGDLTGDVYWYEKGHGVALDDVGGIYVCGDFRGLCDFDPGPGVTEYTSNGYEDGGFDAFVSKFDTSGEFQWARIWGSPVIGDFDDPAIGDTAFGVAVDSFGDVYAYGGFLGTVDFDPSGGVEERTSICPYGDTCLVKYSPSGDFLWVNAWACIGACDFPGVAQMWGGSYVTVNSADDIYVSGTYEDPVDFDPGPGEDIRDGPGAFVSKFAANGDFIDALIWTGDRLLDVTAYGVAADGDDNLYVTGRFSKTADLDPGPGTDEHTASGRSDAYLCKLDADGGFLWALSWGSQLADDFAEDWGAVTDENGCVYAVGIFQGTVDFDPGPDTDFHHGDNWSSYLVKYTPDGTW